MPHQPTPWDIEILGSAIFVALIAGLSADSIKAGWKTLTGAKKAQDDAIARDRAQLQQERAALDAKQQNVINGMTARIDGLEGDIARLNGQITDLSNKNAVKDKIIEDYRRQVKRLEAEKTKLRKERDEAVKAAESGDTSEQFDRMQKQIKTLEGEIARLQRLVDAAQSTAEMPVTPP